MEPRILCIIAICQLGIIDRVLRGIQTCGLGSTWLVTPHSIRILAIKMIVTLRIHNQGYLITISGTAAGKRCSLNGRNIPFESSNEIGAALSLDLGPLRIACTPPWLMERNIATILITLCFIGSIHIIQCIGKTVMRI